MKKKIVLFADYPSGFEIAKFLKKRKESIVGLVIVKQKRNKLNLNSSIKIEKLFKNKKIPILNWHSISNGSNHFNKLKSLKADIFLFLNFPKIIKKNIIDLAERCINLHLSYLPYNRGKNPNVWSIIENTPSGATLHEIDQGIDTGKIIFKKKIIPEAIDTGKSLWEKCSNAAIKLFKSKWTRLRDKRYKSYSQKNKKSTFHHSKDIKKIDEIYLNKKYKASELINILRSRTFNDFPSAFIKVKGKKIFLRLKLTYK